jgi:hypothetical protein
MPINGPLKTNALGSHNPVVSLINYEFGHTFGTLESRCAPFASPGCGTRTRLGFSVADEFLTEQLLGELKTEEGLPLYTDITTALDRNGSNANPNDGRRRVFNRYKERLRQAKLLDYDDVLYLSHRTLEENNLTRSAVC